jgi:hypothetical protein
MSSLVAVIAAAVSIRGIVCWKKLKSNMIEERFEGDVKSSSFHVGEHLGILPPIDRGIYRNSELILEVLNSLSEVERCHKCLKTFFFLKERAYLFHLFEKRDRFVFLSDIVVHSQTLIQGFSTILNLLTWSVYAVMHNHRSTKPISSGSHLLVLFFRVTVFVRVREWPFLQSFERKPCPEF